MDNLLVKLKRREIMNKGEQGLSMYLLGLLVDKEPYLLFPTTLGFGRHLLWVASSVSKTVNFALACSA